MTEQYASILVVDDDVDTCRNLSDILGDLGYQVDTACDGPAALEMVRQKRYDVALLDLRMPGMDGLDVYREIRDLRAGTVALIVTAVPASDRAAEAAESGVWRVLSKPIDFAVLLPLVREAVDQPLILVVDDDHELCANLQQLFQEHQCRVCLAHDSEEVAERLLHDGFQVALIDMKLPEHDGFHVFQRVRQACPAARVVMITGYHEEDEIGHRISQALDAGADAVCYKPFDMPQLIETVQRLADRR
jgi:CheY-like chemotaxis protein